MTRLSKDLAQLAIMTPAQLRDAWATTSPEPVPGVPDALLRRMVAQGLQEKRLGALPVSVRRELERIASGTTGSETRRQSVSSLTPGTRLVREWNGRTISVEVQEEGFVWEGRRYRSLSQIARAVTGTQWSGPRFFGLGSHG